MNDREKSHAPIVPTKLRNKAAEAGADEVEGRGATTGNLIGQNARRTQSRGSAPNELDRVREAAKRDRKMQFTGLLHHITEERLTSVYRRLRKRAAAGVDGVMWDEYGKGLEEKIRELHSRIHRGAYRPKPTRRTYIRKADGSQRPLGIATIEDKVVQGAVAEVLNAIYEEDFYGFCYGFRRGMSQHDALDALSVALKRKRVNWVLDADIRSFFDSVGHEWIRKFLEHRIGDQRVVRLILKWLHAGVMEEGEWKATERGSPQGATISPLLANMYLYYAFDRWAHHWRNKQASGDVVIVRSRKLHELREELTKRRHDPVPEQGKWLRSVILGFDQYHGVPGNIDALNAFRKAVFRLWRQSLQRRSQKGRVAAAIGRTPRLPRSQPGHSPQSDGDTDGFEGVIGPRGSRCRPRGSSRS
ncbi:MAG TPA: reverse transcriptase domain-containing protein [Thermoanaerobaculia bacterium]|nr:reverse transcriptase domain-containing protein [Thermoanaerobaculia bacterium]